jgi:hypothetical protein
MTMLNINDGNKYPHFGPMALENNSCSSKVQDLHTLQSSNCKHILSLEKRSPVYTEDRNTDIYLTSLLFIKAKY